MAKQQIVKFDNGSTLIYQKDGSFNGAKFAIGFLSGAKLDGKHKGLAHLAEHLMFRTTNEKTTEAMLYDLLKYTTNENARTTKDMIITHFTTTNKNIEKVLDLYSNKILFNKKFSDEQIAKEIEVIRHEIEMIQESDSLYIPNASDLLLENLIINDRTSKKELVGTTKTLKTITPKMLHDYVDRYFNAENLIISVTSNKPLNEIIDLCVKHFIGKVKPAKKPEYIVPMPEELKVSNTNMFIANPDPESYTTTVTFFIKTGEGRIKNPELEYALEILEDVSVYGSDNSSGLMHKALRYDNQLVYQLWSSDVDLDTAQFKALTAVTNSKKLRKTIKEICKMVKDLGLYGITKERFDAAKQVLTDTENANLNKFPATSPLGNLNDYITNTPFIDYKKVMEYIKNISYEEFNDYLLNKYFEPNVSVGITGNFDARQCYNLIEIEKMMGNYAHAGQEDVLNLPIAQATLPSRSFEHFNQPKKEQPQEEQNLEQEQKQTYITIDNQIKE